MGGTLFTMFIRFIDPPTLFTLPEIGIKFPLIALIGGIGTIYGPLLGAALVVPLENYIRATLGGLWPGAHLVVLGALLMLTALFLKRGIVGTLRRRRAAAAGGADMTEPEILQVQDVTKRFVGLVAVDARQLQHPAR